MISKKEHFIMEVREVIELLTDEKRFVEYYLLMLYEDRDNDMTRCKFNKALAQRKLSKNEISELHTYKVVMKNKYGKIYDNYNFKEYYRDVQFESR